MDAKNVIQQYRTKKETTKKIVIILPSIMYKKKQYCIKSCV